MADNLLTQDCFHAIVAVGAYLEQQYGGVVKLSQKELDTYRYRNPVSGWKIGLDINSVSTPIAMLVGEDFPYDLPSVYLVGEKKALVWPHVEIDNRLCIYPDHTAFSPADPVGVVKDLIQEAELLLLDLFNGKCDDDFAVEFQSYWLQSLDFKYPRAVTTVSNSGRSRHIAVWAGATFSFFSDSPNKGAFWLGGYFQKECSASDFEKALYLWLDTPLLPSGYPKTNADIVELAKSAGAEALLLDLLTEEMKVFYVLIGFQTRNGQAVAAVRLQRLDDQYVPHGRSVSSINKGFRPGKVPKKVLARRMLGVGTKLHGLETIRADELWIHSRGGEGLPNGSKRICVIGCGSLGAQVAFLLAQAGYDLTVIDPEALDWENVGRHVLGGPRSICQNKAKALANHLHQQLPHRDIKFHETTWMSVWGKSPDAMMECDIIVSTTGDWASEAALNRLNRNVPGFPRLVFGWTEAHALAGHALIVCDVGGCLSCGMSGTGHFSQEVILWNEGTMLPVPACGGFYQPYGPIDLAQIQGMIARAVMDVAEDRVKKSEHRVWLGDLGHIDKLGGTLSSVWTQLDVGSGFREYRSQWATNSNCGLCRPNA